MRGTCEMGYAICDIRHTVRVISGDMPLPAIGRFSQSTECTVFGRSEIGKRWTFVQTWYFVTVAIYTDSAW